jgi:hypothetical protein
MKDTLLNYFKSLPIEKRKTKKGFLVSFANSYLRRMKIEPKPTSKELDQAIKWLEDNNLSLGMGKKADYLVKD